MSGAGQGAWYVAEQAFDGKSLSRDLVIHVGHEGRVRVADRLPEGEHAGRLQGCLVPGFIDLQVNGGGGVLYNDDPSPEGLAQIVAAHRGYGTVGIFPTVITDREMVLERAVERALEAWGMPGMLGIHIEGPHLSEVRRGTHAAEYVRPMDQTTMGYVRRLRSANVPVMITVAPEVVSAEHIRSLADMGAIVSIGHTDATADGARAALDAGATCFTHLFNAMSPIVNRAPGTVGAAINSTAYAGIICDGIHVADELVSLAVRARPKPNTTFLVSDAMPTLGGPPAFRLYGRDIHLEDGRLVNEEGSLAGAHISVAESVKRLIEVVGLAPETALAMGVSVAADLIARPDLARLDGRSADDLIMLDQDWSFAGTLAERFASLRGEHTAAE